jgi:hypothetical protein
MGVSSAFYALEFGLAATEDGNTNLLLSMYLGSPPNKVGMIQAVLLRIPMYTFMYT